ncbi:5-formyltetrahydrofolate cyclo-ligase, mitochondrial [Rutidosis leptorrhynchoides]|uniref:5-formyltetrahydrofolate cyclo-ligase, mitochondrial n=1 Tax=Rutidosis leptorrhynchoides TaxID=125765 RepID=UPI003A99C665
MGPSYKGLRRLVALTMSYPFTIATPPIQPAFPFTPSLILRQQTQPPFHRRTSATMTTTTNHLEEIFTQKRLVRSKVKKDLRSMDPTLRSQQDDAIQNLILDAPWFKSSKRLCAYISCSALREVDTSRILQHVLQNESKDGETKKILYVPRVEDKNCYMRMLNISGMDDLIANSMNILEPAPVDANGNDREDVMLANEPVDLLLLPGLAFDKTGRRLGRGGGYYDTFLSKYQELARQRNWKQPLLIALSYSVQILDDGVVPLTPSDVFIDGIVSPSGFIPISPVAHEICH